MDTKGVVLTFPTCIRYMFNNLKLLDTRTQLNDTFYVNFNQMGPLLY